MVTGEVPDVGLEESDDWILRGEEAREFLGSSVGSVASLVRTTLGPKGCEKLIQTVDSHDQPETVLTADADELLSALERSGGFNHPGAALLIDAVDSLRRGLDDGTTTALLLTGALVDEGIELVDEGLEPMTVVIGYALANARTGEILDDLARDIDPDSVDELRDVVTTTMTIGEDDDWNEKAATAVAEVVAGMARATDHGWIDTDKVSVVGSTKVETEVVDGIILRRKPASYHEMEEIKTLTFDKRPSVPEPIDDATIAIVDEEIDFEETATPFEKHNKKRVALSSPDAVENYVDQLETRRTEVAERLHGLGVDVLVVQERVEAPIRKVFEREGIAVIERAKFPYEDGERLAEATGARVVSYLDDLSAEHLGTTDRVSDRLVGDEKWAAFEGCGGGVYTLVVGAKTESGVRRRERLVSDALTVTGIAASDRQVLPGAGAAAVAVARGLREYATSIDSREQLAVEAFADAVETIPRTLAENAGHDHVDVLAALQAAHADGRTAAGVNATISEPVDAWKAGIVEPRRVFSQSVETAVGITEQLLTLDAVLFPEAELSSFDPLTEHE